MILWLAVFLVAALSTVWIGALAGNAGPLPEPEITAEVRARGACALPAEEMRATHMDLLVRWRDEYVREGLHEYEMPDGRMRPRSLTRTCMGCHTNYEQFCRRCHSQAGVEPDCWSCHATGSEGS